MNLRRPSSILLLPLLSTLMLGASINGTVINKTTNKPAAGDDVILLKLSQGMEETARATSDARGHFVLNVPEGGGTFLIRVMHQKVPYHHPAPAGTSEVEVSVYDAAPEIAGISGAADVLRLQAENGTLEVTDMYALKNNSDPPRSKMSAKTFEIYLPAGAQIDGSLAAGPGGMPVNSAPIPEAEQNKYAFIFPIRPGETRFQVSYHLPYQGRITLEPRLTMDMENFVVMAPKSMHITSPAGTLQPTMEDQGMNVYLAKNVPAGQKITFEVSGLGSIPREQQSDASGDNRPGGGLGAPLDTPDPLHKYRWWILAAVVMLLALGAAYVLRPAAATSRNAPFHPMQAKSTLLLDALKEELFRLESDRISGRIAPAEYAETKNALDIVLARAISRNGSSPAVPVRLERS